MSWFMRWMKISAWEKNSGSAGRSGELVDLQLRSHNKGVIVALSRDKISARRSSLRVICPFPPRSRRRHIMRTPAGGTTPACEVSMGYV